MATTVQAIKKEYPLPVYNFRVRLGTENHGFVQVSGLNLQYSPITYKHGLSWLEGEIQIPGSQQPLNVTLERGLIKRKSDFWDWIQDINFGLVVKRDLTVDLCDETGIPVISWMLKNAFPTQLDAPTFNVGSNEVAIEKLQLMANGLLVEYHK
jgi:phage tail-like protein